MFLFIKCSNLNNKFITIKKNIGSFNLQMVFHFSANAIFKLRFLRVFLLNIFSIPQNVFYFMKFLFKERLNTNLFLKIEIIAHVNIHFIFQNDFINAYDIILLGKL